MAGSESPMGRSQGQRGSMAGIARPSTASPGGRVQAFGSPSSSPFAALGGSFKGNSLQSMPGPERESIRPATAVGSRQRRSSVDISRQLFAQSCSVCKRKYPDECLCVAEVVSPTPPRYLLPSPISPIPASFPPCPPRASVLNVCAIHLQEKRKKAEEIAEWKRKRLAAGLSTQTDEEMQERIQVKLCVSPLSSLPSSAPPAPLPHFLLLVSATSFHVVLCTRCDAGTPRSSTFSIVLHEPIHESLQMHRHSDVDAPNNQNLKSPSPRSRP